MRITCGIDWAEGHHDVALLDGHGALLAKKRIGTGFRGFTELLAVIADLGGVPGDVPVAIETDKNLIVVALQAAGFVVHAVNPRAVARYRSVMPRRAASPTPATRSCWRTSSAPTRTCTGRCPRSPSSVWR